MSEYIQEALDVRDVVKYILGASKHSDWALKPGAQIVGFTQGKRDYIISIQNESLRADFTGNVKKAREKIAERKLDAVS